MAAKIARIWNEDCGDMLVVPGVNPAEILADASLYLDDDERIVTTSDEVRVRWWRVSPCHPNSCPEGGGHHTHYEDSHRKTRGSFQAAGLEIDTTDDRSAF